ncbi:hypothetical protein BB559_004043 [Furculomyces boomerangus]|uniref:Sugar phosphate transporter domain-containing protein n=2 Tax=Harpellales TaxID=61421 RepID=A0A2T9YHA4_9FUNG|nr:hypothetical protein BB559_004043 [Furculomyces boomerangus]PWA00597.1 hypothetical protein BB558_003355 [Smittium angustum]
MTLPSEKHLSQHEAFIDHTINIDQIDFNNEFDKKLPINTSLAHSSYSFFQENKSAFVIAAYCFLWFFSAIFSSNTGKAILNIFNYPVTLSFSHFISVAIFSVLNGIFNPQLLNIKVSFSDLKKVAVISTNQVVGHIIGSIAVSYAPVSLVHTIKGITPLFTIIACRVLFNTVYSKRVYISLVPLIVGIGLTSFKADGLTTIGFMFCLMSSLTCAIGGIVNKYVINTLSSPKTPSTSAKYKVMYHASIVSIIFVFPIWIWSEGHILFPQITQAAFDTLKNNGDTSIEIKKHNWSYLLILFILNNIFCTCQAFSAISIISIATPVTFSIASLLKRIFVIIAAIVWFKQKISSLQAFGIVIFMVGLFMYGTSKKTK